MAELDPRQILRPPGVVRGIEKEMDAGRIDSSGVMQAIAMLSERGRIPLLVEAARIPAAFLPDIEADGCILSPSRGTFYSPITDGISKLTNDERKLTYFLMARKHRVSTKEELAQFIDSIPKEMGGKINGIRHKVDSQPPQLFHTQRGIGFYFRRIGLTEES